MNCSRSKRWPVSNAYEIAALVAVLERILTQAEVLDEIARQKEGRARGR